MSKPLKLNLNELSDSHYFPEIKSQKSAANSPRNNLKNSVNPVSDSKLKQNKSDDLLITKLNEKSKKFGAFSKKLSENPISKKQYLGLLKFVKEREEYIETIEKQLQDMNESSKVRIDEKTDAVVKERSPKLTGKFSEVLKLRTDNEDLRESLQKLSKNLMEQKLKLDENENLKEKLLKKISILEKNLEMKNSELESFHQKTLELKSETSRKSEELEDLERLLKISEDKRKLAVDQVTSMEKKFFNIKSKNFNITSNQNELKVSLDDVTRSLLSRETELKDCWEQVKDLQKRLTKERHLNSTLRTDLEMTKTACKTNEACLNSKLEEISKENLELKETLSKSLQNIRKTAKRAETVVASKYIDGYTEQELFRIQQKYFESEEKLISTSLELERIKRDDIYLQNQLEVKNALIEKLNRILNETPEHSGSLKVHSNSLPFDSYQELIEIIDKVILQNDLASNNLKCSSCTSSNQSTGLNYPCLHIECSSCSLQCEKICQTCSSEVLLSIPMEQFSVFSSHLKSVSSSLTHMKLLLNSLTF